MPTMTVQSAAMRRLHRDLAARRMKGDLAPAGGVSKKPSTKPPLFFAPTDPPARRAAGSCPRQTTKPADPTDIKTSSVSFIKGAHVRVRTPVGTLRTGRPLLLWLSAVVVSAAEEEEDGHLGVVYTHYKNPRSSVPFCTVRVHKSDVKNMPVPPAAAAVDGTTASFASSSEVATCHPACPSQGQGTAAPLRPTVAGKKPALLKKMEKEMRSKSDAILDSWR